MSKPTPLSGFPELLPAQRAAELAVIEQLRAVFELHGFASLETRIVEPLDRLAKGGDVDKEIYVLRRFQADADEATSDAALGLHFDLTVPFARYVVENSGKLEFPFRRYQIQKAWRGERPQEGRFREFIQADIDIIGKDELPFHYDVEVARVISDALAPLPLPAMSLQVNSRRLIEGFYRGLGATDPQHVIRIMDKVDKLPRDAIVGQLVDAAGLGHDQAQACLRLAEIRTADTSFLAAVWALGVEH